MYADYTFYVDEYLGSMIHEADWNKYATRASDYIDYITGGKAAGYDDVNNNLAKACCAVAEQIAVSDTISASVAGVASETVGSHSVSYRSQAEIKAGAQSAMLSAAQMYLFPTGLLYRGVPCIRRIP